MLGRGWVLNLDIKDENNCKSSNIVFILLKHDIHFKFILDFVLYKYYYALCVSTFFSWYFTLLEFY
jgi:hypothetical protein